MINKPSLPAMIFAAVVVGSALMVVAAVGIGLIRWLGHWWVQGMNAIANLF